MNIVERQSESHAYNYNYVFATTRVKEPKKGGKREEIYINTKETCNK